MVRPAGRRAPKVTHLLYAYSSKELKFLLDKKSVLPMAVEMKLGMGKFNVHVQCLPPFWVTDDAVAKDF